MPNDEFVHFDEVEGELDLLMRALVKELQAIDPSVVAREVDADDIADRYTERFISESLVPRRMDCDRLVITEHLVAVVEEYDKVDMAVQAKVEDQTPELGITALISEHKSPIMQMLQQKDEGY